MFLGAPSQDMFMKSDIKQDPCETFILELFVKVSQSSGTKNGMFCTLFVRDFFIFLPT